MAINCIRFSFGIEIGNTSALVKDGQFPCYTELRIATLRKYSEYSITSILIREIIQTYSMNADFEVGEYHNLTQKWILNNLELLWSIKCALCNGSGFRKTWSKVLYFQTFNDVNSAYYNNESQGTFMYVPVYSSWAHFNF